MLISLSQVGNRGRKSSPLSRVGENPRRTFGFKDRVRGRALDNSAFKPRLSSINRGHNIGKKRVKKGIILNARPEPCFPCLSFPIPLQKPLIHEVTGSPILLLQFYKLDAIIFTFDVVRFSTVESSCRTDNAVRFSYQSLAPLVGSAPDPIPDR